MNELLSGWKDKKEVYIPPIEKYGFAEDVIIRNIRFIKIVFSMMSIQMIIQSYLEKVERY